MNGWKSRIVDEYHQTKERYEKLKAFNNKCDIEGRLRDFHAISEAEGRRKEIEHMLCKEQQSAMGEYLHFLELRAELYGITLYESQLEVTNE